MQTTFTSPHLTPYQLTVPDGVLDDLNRRLDATRWPASAPGEPWRWGTDVAFMQRLVEHWRHAFDWRAWETCLNAYPQFIAQVDDLDIHVLVEQGSGDNPLPLVLTHGWPGSVFELLALIEPLAHPERFGGAVEDAFTVVVPSLPGFGLSPTPSAVLTPRVLAQTWHTLMRDVLGFDRYVAHGGDTGATVASWMGLEANSHFPAIHLNTAVLFADWTLADTSAAEEELAYLQQQQQRMAGEDAYQAIHAEKPATLSFSLADSPVGLAAWIVEKFHGWTSPGAPTLSAIDADHLLLNIMPYWLGLAHPVHWLYQGLRDMSGYRLPAGQKIATPAGFLLFPNDIVVAPPRQWLDRAYTVASLKVAAAGGHFPGVENPDLLTQDIRDFFRPYRH
ncbi:MAG: epoxide hydrolase [Verrucomicrobiaceae bacterium]|nr:epoxide hydrolase [Verrucomicrobiaceae bacterium]